MKQLLRWLLLFTSSEEQEQMWAMQCTTSCRMTGRHLIQQNVLLDAHWPHLQGELSAASHKCASPHHRPTEQCIQFSCRRWSKHRYQCHFCPIFILLSLLLLETGNFAALEYVIVDDMLLWRLHKCALCKRDKIHQERNGMASL